MGAFLEERLSVAVKYGATYGDDYSVEITKTKNGSEYRNLLHPFPVREFHFAFDAKATTLYQNIANTYHRAFGRYAGFRVKCLDDYTTNGQTGAPTAFDQALATISLGATYQLQKVYGEGGTPLSIGRPYRTIFKPVAATTLVGINGVLIRSSDWSVDTTTGIITFVADVTTGVAITAVSKANPCVITYASAPPFVTGQAVNLSNFAGMTQLNGQRSLITVSGNNVTLTGINSSAYSVWSSGGTLHTRPQTGEAVTGGCEFDIPARFDSTLNITQNLIDYRDIAALTLLEILNP
jgi:uncharacterized protein (TIGR02217 family)